MTLYRGNLYKPNSADAEPVEIELHGRDILIRRSNAREGAEEVIPLERLKLSAGGFDGKRLVMENTTDGVTVIADSDGILKAIEAVPMPQELADSIRVVRSSIDSIPHTERKHWGILLSAIIVIGLIVYFSVDALVALTVDHVPPSFEKRVGDIVVDDYKRSHQLETGGADVARLQHIVDRLTRELPHDGYVYRVYLERTNDVNAFAVPGGNIVVFSGLLDSARNDSEIAGVLGHEIGHVIGRHSLRASLHSAGLLACLNLLMQGNGGAAASWLGSAINLDSLRYGREQEAAADKTGVDLTFKADYDPHGLLNFFDRMQRENSSAADNRVLEFLSDHPCTPARIDAIRHEIADIENNAKHGARVR